MNNINKTSMSPIAQADWSLKAGLLPMLLGIAALGSAPVVLAVDECGPGPTVSCAVGAYASGITYNFSSDLSVTTLGSVTQGPAVGAAAFGMRLNGDGNANLTFDTNGRVTGAGGVHVNLERGNFEADIRYQFTDGTISTDANIGTGLNVHTGGSANVRIHGNQGVGTAVYRLSNLVMDVGSDSTVRIDYRRAVMAMTLSPRAGATLTINNDRGIIGNDNAFVITPNIVLRGAGAGDVVLNNAIPGARISGRMDYTGMTGSLTILNDHAIQAEMGGWRTRGENLFGSGDVEIFNGLGGVLRTASEAILDFSDARSSRFVNYGRVMVGAPDNATYYDPRHLRFIGLDRFENAGLILMGTVYSAKADQGLVTNGFVGDRLSFENSHYIGMEGGRIAFDAALAKDVQTDCSVSVAADCVRFIGGSTTEGTTLLRISDLDPRREAGGFNPGIVLIEGASAAGHFILDPTSDFYVANTTEGAALQKGMIAYRLQYDADTRQHALVGTLADEAAQASTLGAAAHEVWRASTDTWFDRQASMRNQQGEDPGTEGLWFTANTSKGDRNLRHTVDVAGIPTDFNLAQDQIISHLAFGLDVLSGSGGGQSWNAGVTMGLLYSAIDYEATRTKTTLSGMAAGVYGGWAWAGLTVDGMANLNFARQSLDGSSFGLGEHNRLRTQVKSTGGRLEAAWKLPMSESLWLQPLVGVSHVVTNEGDAKLPDGAGGVRFGNDDRSWRVGAGLRVGVDSHLAGLRAQYRLTGRMWNERDAHNSVLVDVGSEPQPVPIVDDFGGNFNEVDGSVLLSNEAGSLSGYVGINSKFGDDYRRVGGSMGMRYSW